MILDWLATLDWIDVLLYGGGSLIAVLACITIYAECVGWIALLYFKMTDKLEKISEQKEVVYYELQDISPNEANDAWRDSRVALYNARLKEIKAYKLYIQHFRLKFDEVKVSHGRRCLHETQSQMKELETEIFGA